MREGLKVSEAWACSTGLQCVGKFQRVRSVSVHGELSGQNACKKKRHSRHVVPVLRAIDN